MNSTVRFMVVVTLVSTFWGESHCSNRSLLQRRGADYTAENRLALQRVEDFLNEGQLRNLRKVRMLAETDPSDFLRFIEGYKALNKRRFADEARQRGYDPDKARVAYVRGGHNAGCGALEGVYDEQQEGSSGCNCAMQCCSIQ